MKQIKIIHSLLTTFFITTLVLFNTSQCIAQNYSITGKITDTLNNPIEYVNVALIGTTYGDASDVNGIYEISNLDAGTYNIKFSAIGYVTREIEKLVISDHSIKLNIVLIQEIEEK